LSRRVTNIDTAFEKQIFDLTERQRITDVQHHGRADDIRRTVEISERITHPPKLRTPIGITQNYPRRKSAIHTG
jgi:hypothetical protein